MLRSVSAVTGSILIIAYIAYAFSGIRTEGPGDKIIQLLVLVPAVVCISWALSGRIMRNLAAAALRRLDGWRTVPFLVTLSLVLFLFTLWMAYFPLEGTAKGGDESATLFQARIFARGELAAPAPPVPDPEVYFSSRHLVIHDGRWFGQYTPTHSLLLAPFVRVGLSPLLGPVEGVLSLIGIFLLVRIWKGERSARLVSLLLLLSLTCPRISGYLLHLYQVVYMDITGMSTPSMSR
ncbi:MAG: hypothetical protein JXA64_07700 [Candidatus Fermentibacteraceae bacterium]|nr:hypothetical protein [Candidatus Fermentibacteraceae bacterium]